MTRIASRSRPLHRPSVLVSLWLGILLGIGLPCELASETQGRTPPHQEARPLDAPFQGRPNVVLIIGDDQAFDDFGFAGHDVIETPRIDHLARESALFRGYVTAPLCRPSLATLATGLFPHQHRVVGNDPAEGMDGALIQARLRELPTVARLLRKAGYRTLQTGKWWEGSHADGGFTDGMTHGDPRRGGRHGDAGLRIGRPGHEPIAEFLDQEGVGTETPFFIWHAPFLPHTPHNAPPRLQERYTGEGRHPAEARYFANCTWFDESVGAVLDLLEERGLTESTLVILCVDNGWVTLENGRGDFRRSKRSPYERGVRTPVLLRWSGRVAPGRRPQVVSTVDVAPTILTACDVESPVDLPGRDLLEFAGDPTAERGPVFGGAWAHDQADAEDPGAGLEVRFVVDGADKLILPSAPERPTELYDVLADPDELQNRAAAEPERVAALRALVDAWWLPDGQ